MTILQRIEQVIIDEDKYPDMRLGRHVLHDSRSKRYAVDTTGLKPKTVRWVRRVDPFDQGELGSCTGNAAVGCLGTEPFYDTAAVQALGVAIAEKLAVDVYSEATSIDPYQGQYPPTDTGSDGLSVAKVLKSRGLIAGFMHTFSFDQFVLAMQKVPAITGVNWYSTFDDPSPDGIVDIMPGARIRGGHEFEVAGVNVEEGLVECINSWGPDWGDHGRFYIPFNTYRRLLAEQGDVTYFVPGEMPAPTPTPDPTPPTPDYTPSDLELWLASKKWAKALGLPA